MGNDIYYIASKRTDMPQSPNLAQLLVRAKCNYQIATELAIVKPYSAKTFLAEMTNVEPVLNSPVTATTPAIKPNSIHNILFM